MGTLKNEKIEIGIIANSLSPQNREALVEELGRPQDGIFSPLKFQFRGSRGHIIPLDFLPTEIASPRGMRAAKLMMDRAVEKLLSAGAQVICFTAATKRLPGINGERIPTPFQGKTLYSIGDNATALSLIGTLTKLFGEFSEGDKVGILGYGFLGEQTLKTALRFQRPESLTVVTQQSIDLKPGVNRVGQLIEIASKLKLLVVCTHKHLHNISKDDLEAILSDDAIIVDVSAPPGISREVIYALDPKRRRYSAGDFIVPGLEYRFEPSLLGFPNRKFFYGCFTEALILGLWADKIRYQEKPYDFFSINHKSMLLLASGIKKIGATVPEIDFFAINN